MRIHSSACLLCLAIGSAAAAQQLTVPDLDPVTIKTAPEHEPVALVRKAKPLAVVYVKASRSPWTSEA